MSDPQMESNEASKVIEAIQMAMVSLAADMNRLIVTHASAVWVYLALKGISTKEDSAMIDQAYAMAVSMADQMQAQAIQEGMVDLTESQREMVRKAMGMTE